MVESNFLYFGVYKYILMCERRRDSMLVKEIEMKKWGNSQGIRFGKEDKYEWGNMQGREII